MSQKNPLSVTLILQSEAEALVVQHALAFYPRNLQSRFFRHPRAGVGLEKQGSSLSSGFPPSRE